MSDESKDTINIDKKITTIIEENVTNDDDGDGIGEGNGDGDGSLVDTTKCINNPLIKAAIETEVVEKDIGAGGDIGELKQNEEETIMNEEKLTTEPPPPLPISPPPSQVVAFALNADLVATENEINLEQDQSPKIPIAELEAEFEAEFAAHSEKTYNQFIESAEENKIEKEHMEMEQQYENLVLPEPTTEVLDFMDNIECQAAGINAEELEVKATATFMVDEITAKAMDIVVDMSNIIQKQHEEQANETLGQLEEYNCNNNDDEELPPPPPTPPSQDEENFMDAEEGKDVINAYDDDIPVSVEEVLNQFESKINEIEQKVMNFGTTSSSEQDEISMADDVKSMSEENNEQNTENIKNEEESQSDNEAIYEDKAKQIEIEADNTDKHEMKEDKKEDIENNKIEMEEDDEPRDNIATVEIHEIEENLHESLEQQKSNEINLEEYYCNETQEVVARTQNETKEQNETNNETEKTELNEIDTTAIITEELNKLTFKDIDHKTILNAEAKEFVPDEKKANKLQHLEPVSDLENVKVNTTTNNKSNNCILVIYYSLLL